MLLTIFKKFLIFYSFVAEIGDVVNSVDFVDDEKDRLLLVVSFCVEPDASNVQGALISVLSMLLMRRSDGVLASLPETSPVLLAVVEPSLKLDVNSAPRYGTVVVGSLEYMIVVRFVWRDFCLFAAVGLSLVFLLRC